ncbi:Rdx family-domain-containing protein [Hypoxylon trugodes]|uniref:Rdx family-domain-containing protein n=1 Tax=Hypoxylon trugodes TaxID=326681 RepID=UPI0021961494|nr:Rdx family-domain-containing protein [Hypoxylon trugodes]KAI1393449.1 Rdx family-domain-containing protein [Hypoxylon trugodes]
MAETETKTSGHASPDSPYPLPRVTIRFCTQCKWMLRAAYFAQELLSTFSTSLGEVALQPSTGGTFIVEIFFTSPTPPPESQPRDPSSTSPTPTIQQRILWNRKTDGGFPETKELKRRVRDTIEPGRNLGHVDKDYGKAKNEAQNTDTQKPVLSKAGEENTLGLNTHPEANIGGPACKPGTESAGTNKATQDECEDCK